METTTEPTMEKTYCMDCGTVFEYESILFGNIDFGLSMSKYCPECEESRRKAERDALKAREDEINRARVMATLDPELLPVWLDPLGTDPERADFNREKWEKVRKWRPGPHGNGLGLIGAAGTCKTRILALLAEKIMMQGIRLVWTSAMRLHTESAINMRSHDRKLMQSARDHFYDCMQAGYLVIDDLGNNEWCPAFESQLFTILDHRKNNRLPTLWSSNKPPEAFHLVITSVNPAALIGRLIGDTNTLTFEEMSLI